MNIKEIIERLKLYIYEENLISFFIILLILQYISMYFEKVSTIIIFQPVIVTAIYTYINTELQNGMYIFLMAGLIASLIPYILWNLLNKRINHIWLNTSSALLSALMMKLFGCFSPPAVGYAFSSTVLIPKLGQGFLFSYLTAAIFSILFIEIYDAVFASNLIRKTLEEPIHYVAETKDKSISNKIHNLQLDFLF